MVKEANDLTVSNQISTGDDASRTKGQLAPWRSPLSRALHRNRALAYARYGQLATVRADGRPANRTVVFRGFLDQPDGLDWNGLKFICDRRSAKVAELEANPWAELCWYFPKTREQFRLAGKVAIALDGQDTLGPVRQQTWEAISANAQTSFYWPEPGQPRAEQAAFERQEQPVEANQSSLPPDDFVLLVLQPLEVDHLELRGEPQNRWRYSQTEERAWQSLEVNP